MPTMRVSHVEDELENHDRGLDYDLPRLPQRRGMLKLVAGASLVTLTGCATAGTTSSAASSDPPASASSSGSLRPADGSPSGAPPGGPPAGESGGSDRDVSAGEIPEETAGPIRGTGPTGRTR
jgi:hypothetical protein